MDGRLLLFLCVGVGGSSRGQFSGNFSCLGPFCERPGDFLGLLEGGLRSITEHRRGGLLQLLERWHGGVLEVLRSLGRSTLESLECFS